MVKTPRFQNTGMQLQSLVGKLRSYMLHGEAKNKKFVNKVMKEMTEKRITHLP